MSDSINVDYNNQGPAMPSALQALSQGTQVGQQVGAASALHGLNMNDPSSVDATIGGLAQHGALEQGSALAGLSEARQKLSLWPAGIELGRRNLQAALAEQSSDNSDASPALAAPPAAAPGAPAPTANNFAFDPVNTRNIMLLAQNATQQLLNAPPEQRPALAAQIKAQMVQKGVPEPAIDRALNQQPDGSYGLDDGHLKGLHDYYQGVTQQLGQAIAAKQQPQAAGTAPGAPPPAPGAPTPPPGPVTGAGAPGVAPPTTTVSTPGGVAPPPAESTADVAAVAPRLPTHVNPYPAAPAPAEAAGAAPAAANPLLTHDSNNWSASYLHHPAVIAANKWMATQGIPGVADLEPTAMALESPNIARQSQLNFTQPQQNATDAVTLGTTTVNGRQLQAPQLLIRAAEGGVPGLDPTQAQMFLHERAASPGNVGVGFNPAEQAYLSGSGAAQASSEHTIGTDVINGQPIRGVQSALIQAHNAGTPGLGVDLTPAAAAAIPGDAKALQDYVSAIPTQNLSLQQAATNGQKITALGQAAKTGKYSAQLADVLSSLKLPGQQSDYANNIGQLSSALSGSFQQTLGGMAIPRLNSEAGAITNAIPHVTSQPDQIALYGAGLTAATNYARAQNKFMNDYYLSHPSNPSMAAAQAAWAAGEGRKSFLADPAFTSLKLSNGHQAVMIDPKTGYGFFAPNTPAQFKFQAW